MQAASMPGYTTPLALVLYLVPLVLVLVVRSSRDRPLWEIALDVPTVVALDILLVEGLSKFVLVEKAVIASRVIWAIAAGAWWVVRARRGEKLGWPRGLGPKQVVVLLVAAGLGVLLSVQLSESKMMWDRDWHIPLSASLRGQTLPFHPVFEPDRVLRYHVTGDVFAAEIQVLSRDVMNTSLALSLSHDVLFGLIALSIGLALLHFAHGPIAPALLAPVFLLAGPFDWRGGIGDPARGYSFHDLLSLSFRPGICVGELFIVGFTISVVSRLLAPRGLPLYKTLPSLLVCTAALGLSDESSIGTLGFSLGVTWLFVPKIVADTRRAGLVTFGALFVALLGPNVIFSSALAPGGPLQSITHVPWRNPGFHNAPLPLSGTTAWTVLICDTLPFSLCVLGLSFAWLQRRTRETAAVAIFVTVACVLPTVVLTSLKINQDDDNVQRFMVAPLLVAPLAALLTNERWWSGTVGRLLVMFGLTSGAFSTLYWLREDAPRTGTPSSVFSPAGYDLYSLDCRRVSGARFGERPSPSYVDASLYYVYVGCRPVYVPGGDRARSMWDMKVFPDASPTGFALFDTMLGAADLRVVCPVATPGDQVCAKISDRSACTREGDTFVSCKVGPSERQRILGRRS